MFTAAPAMIEDTSKAIRMAVQQPETVGTRLWIEEHLWLYGVLKSDRNTGPTFRFPDLISACVSLVFSRPDAARHIFGFLGTNLVARPIDTIRRREAMWRQQYELLLELQRSAANRHPNPKFQLDHLTTACVALCQLADEPGNTVLQQARINMAQRMRSGQKSPPD